MTIARTIKFVTALVGSFAAAATILAGTAGAAPDSEEGTTGPTYVEYRDATQGDKRSAPVGTPLGGVVREMNVVHDGNKVEPPEVDWSFICSTRGGAGTLPIKCK